MTQTVLKQISHRSRAGWRSSVLKFGMGLLQLAWKGWRGSEALVLGVFTVCGLLSEVLQPVSPD